jgi:acetyltransferase-like isoleucine patch superfamily enzyme
MRPRRPWLALRSFPGTLRFNLHYFGVRGAVRFPVLISHRVWLDRLNGTVEIAGPIRFGQVRIGFGEVGIFDRERERSVWRVDGGVRFEGMARLGHGTKINVKEGARVTFGDGFVLTAESAIFSRRGVTFGRDVLVSWDVQILDADWHAIVDDRGNVLNPDAEVVVGDGVWIGMRATLLKGAVVADGSIVAAGAIVNREFTEPHVLLAGVPAREVRRGISWRVRPD